VSAPRKPDPDERFKIEGDPEHALRAAMNVRWYVVVVDTGEPELPPNPPGGFATEEEARRLHRTLMHGDPRLEVRAVRVP
jgi:hypothetical protein